ncbi:hypothetical protein J1G44_20135 [Cellulomonas sp. zg-ZUI199]|uniref:SCP domain-containing protein n=1 Tax=Cellulomonas wangleii TaxID=2816956 RepID=A0ABX8DAK4_9CELL|nr:MULTISPECIES: hypothetical protein [Cellulomonas]MBO0901180.1 hypothetical protein [Cellulomonas sp. zg-ZUI22]MBO0924951.1 hypothetical protein [Cellulomonas wangleii]MBO0926787.1 hypothetical protein [Cellulomonas wangleii]QVI63107.1 hypothetical protein KG103_04105 [Cellulomonas wangleii]
MSGRQENGARPDDAGARTSASARAAAAKDTSAAARTDVADAPAGGLPTQGGHAVSGPVPVVPAPGGPTSAGGRGETPTPGPAAVPTSPDRLTVVPTQPGVPTHSASVPVVPTSVDAASVVAAPTVPDHAVPDHAAPEPVAAEPAPQPRAAARPHGRRIVALLTAAGVLVSAGGVWAVQQDRAARADAHRAAQSRVEAVRVALAPELTAPRPEGLVAGTAVAGALRADAGAVGRAAVERANATLAVSAQAGDGPRGALQTAVGGAAAALDAPAVSLTTLRTTTAALAAPQQAVVDAQAAWQAAEDARIAAERAAAEAAAAQAAAARAGSRTTTAKGSSAGSTRRSTGTAPSGGTSGGAPAAAAEAPAAVGLPTAGSEASAGAVGEALNAHRAANGLGALSIVRSGARVEHAMQMAASNSIWHSGTRAGSPKARPEIVGRVSPGNATRMIAAYAGSSGHNQQMLGGYSTAYIGAVSYDGWLYTSITFG